MNDETFKWLYVKEVAARMNDIGRGQTAAAEVKGENLASNCNLAWTLGFTKIPSRYFMANSKFRKPLKSSTFTAVHAGFL